MDTSKLKDKYIGMILDDRYEIIERIGSGGMALVYKARCHKLDRFVAVKILKDELAIDEEFRDRFQNESKAVAMLSHTNIVTVYDVSRSNNPDYIVMEYIEGLTLKEYIQSRGGALTWKESLHFAAQITKALMHAHTKGIIHRDIKPQNIMLLHDSSVKVTDFGIARLAAKSNTLTKDTLGSVHYISPEQAKGGVVDKRTDIYSLGVVLYEMLTGRLPFEAENSVAIALQHFTSTPLTPRELNPDIPKGLESIVLRMMSPDLAKRYVSADALFEDLETFRRHPDTEFDYEDLASTVIAVPEPDEGGNSQLRKARSGRPKPKRTEERQKLNDNMKRARRNVMLVGIILVVVVILAGLVLIWNFIGKDLFMQDTVPMVVPNWETQRYDDVVNDPQYIGFFTFNRRPEPSDTVKEGFIISQSIAPGDRKFEPGGMVNEKGQQLPIEPFNVILTVSSGSETLLMPDIVNQVDYRDAEIQLKTLGLNVEKPIFEVNEEIQNGFVISTQPAAGETVRPGDVVVMHVSSGSDTKPLTVPNLVGRDVDDARLIIERFNFTVGDVTEMPDDAEYGKVLGQEPGPGTEAPPYTVINLVISDGSEYIDPSASPEPEESVSPSPEVTDEPTATDDSGNSPSPDPVSPSPDVHTPEVTVAPESTPEPTPEQTPVPTPVIDNTPVPAESPVPTNPDLVI